MFTEMRQELNWNEENKQIDFSSIYSIATVSTQFTTTAAAFSSLKTYLLFLSISMLRQITKYCRALHNKYPIIGTYFI